MGEYLVDNHGIFDTGDNPNSTTTLGAGFYVDIEYPLQALRSDYCHPGLIAGLVTRFHGVIDASRMSPWLVSAQLQHAAKVRHCGEAVAQVDDRFVGLGSYPVIQPLLCAKTHRTSNCCRSRKQKKATRRPPHWRNVNRPLWRSGSFNIRPILRPVYWGKP